MRSILASMAVVIALWMPSAVMAVVAGDDELSILIRLEAGSSKSSFSSLS